MNDLTVSAHIDPGTRFRVTSFPSPAFPFVSLRIEGTSVEIALLVSAGSADALRDLAAAATEGATVLDSLTELGGGRR